MALLWFRNDLRLNDNEALTTALAENKHILPVYIIDERYLQRDKWGFLRTGAYRMQFLLESLHDLRDHLKEKGGDFSYFMQRAVVGAPGMSDDALAYYTDLFTKVYASDDWQGYKSKKSLMGEFLAGDDLKSYWDVQRDRHEVILRASGAIK